ncbi:MAG: HAMP domain-containing histidine kinase [Myxococcales bacterium]|nr:HAMP domain-containing histidine kinase [Myxococcales bacterium]
MPFFLYPTAEKLFGSSPVSNSALPSLADAWLDLGYESAHESETEARRNIGHVQRYWELPNGWDYQEDLDQRVRGTERETTLFSDLFYGNRSALYINDESAEDGTLVGRLVLCAPTNGILCDIGALWSEASAGAPPERSLIEDVLRRWQRLGGPGISESLRKRHERVREELLAGQVEADEEILQSFIAHTVLGPAADALTYLTRLEAGHNAAQNAPRLRKKLRTLLRNARSVLALWKVSHMDEEGGIAEIDIRTSCLDEIVAAIQADRESMNLPPLQVDQDLNVRCVCAAVPQGVVLLFTLLIDNAVEELDAVHADAAPECPTAKLRIVTRPVETQCEITISNTARPEARETFRRLNDAVAEPMPTWRLSRKGPSHYRLGHRTVRWIVQVLRGRIAYDVCDDECVVRLWLPMGARGAS